MRVIHTQTEEELSAAWNQQAPDLYIFYRGIYVGCFSSAILEFFTEYSSQAQPGQGF